MLHSVKLFCLAGLIAYGPFVLIHALPIVGTGWVIAGVEVFMFVPVLALAAGLLALPCLASTRMRPGAKAVLIVSTGLLIFFIPALGLGSAARRHGFHLAAQRARPLVEAVRAYQKEHGAPPSTIQELVPGYLAAVPARLPSLELIVGEKARSDFEGNDWVLFAIVSTGLLNWDQFMYYPLQNYPDTGHGGWIERVDDWAYVHE